MVLAGAKKHLRAWLLAERGDSSTAFRRGLLQLTAEISGCLARCMLIGSGVAAAATIQAPKHTLKPKLWISFNLHLRGVFMLGV